MQAQFTFILLLTATAYSAIIHVPEDQPTVQLGMDATAPGDTVLVARGIYQELLESPSHGITLCSNYVFTQDSTDIVETVLDGNLEGTVLNIGEHAGETYLVCGMTFQGGMGVETGIYAGCVRAGAINVDTEVNLTVSDCVFRENQSEDGCSVMRHGRNCSGFGGSGSVILSRIHCEDNIDNPSSSYAGIELRSYNADYAELSNLVIDAGTSDIDVLNASFGQIDSLVVSNIRLFNGDKPSFRVYTTPIPGTAPTIEDITTVSDSSNGGCHVRIDVSSLETNTANCTIQNLTASGISGPSIFITSNEYGPHLEIDNIEVSLGHGPGGVHFQTSTSGTIRNLHFHHNTVGDSISLMPSPMIFLDNFNLYNSHIHDNTVIIPSGSLDGAIVKSTINNHARHVTVENVRFEDNLVVDLDDYSNPNPGSAPTENFHRELWLAADTVTVRHVEVRRSRQPNHCPELVVPEWLEMSSVGHTVGLSGDTVIVQDLLLEDCDDGGLSIGGGAFGASLDGIVLRNIGRAGLLTATGAHGIIRNLLIENIVAEDNWLWRWPEYENLSMQAALWVSAGTLVELENSTIIGCDSMRHVICQNPGITSNLVIRNSILVGNSSELLSENGDGDVLTWNHCYIQEAVPGMGNIIGLDPLFDPELGPPFLAPESPCIDAGNPDFVNNDIEDPANPGWALWPSQGGLRNDMGFTGGPGLDSLTVDWLDVEPLDHGSQPAHFTLEDPFPNPFNPVCRIPFLVTQTSALTLSVYNLQGQLVTRQLWAHVPAGKHERMLDGSSWASGVYLVAVDANGSREVKKILLLK